MDKQEIIDYVMSTPYNVNRTILGQMLKDKDGVQADWAAGQGESGHVLNRTHYEEKIRVYENPIVWDGIIEDLLTIELQPGMGYAKISDTVPTVEDFANGGECYTIVNNTMRGFKLQPEDFIEMLPGIFVIGEGLLVVSEIAAGTPLEGLPLTFLKPVCMHCMGWV